MPVPEMQSLIQTIGAYPDRVTHHDRLLLVTVTVKNLSAKGDVPTMTNSLI